MTNKRKVQRFKRMQKNSKERRYAKIIRKVLKDNKKHLYNVSVVGGPLFLHELDKLRIEGPVNVYSSIIGAFNEYKERVKKNFGGS